MSILEEAQDIINGDRAKKYRHPYHNYTNIASTFNALTGKDLTPKDVIMLMLVTKLCREQHVSQRDNLVDLAGYAGCLEKLYNYKEEEKDAPPKC